MTERTSPRTSTAEVATAVLDAAAHLLAAEGPEALSIRRIATAAQVAPMSIYNRFESKAGVLDALFMRGFDRLAAVADDVDPGPGSPLHHLRTFATAYRRFALGDQGTYTLMFDKGVADFVPSATALASAADCFGRLVAKVERGQAAGELVGGDAVEVAQRFWAALHGAVSLERHGICFAADTEQHYVALMETVVAGLRPDGGVPGGWRPA